MSLPPWLLEALACLKPFCDPAQPADCREVACEHARVSLLSRAHRAVAAAAPYCITLPVDALAAAGQLEGCLRWLGGVRVHRLELSLQRADLGQGQVEALGRVLQQYAPAAAARILRLAIMAGRLGERFDAFQTAAGCG